MPSLELTPNLLVGGFALVSLSFRGLLAIMTLLLVLLLGLGKVSGAMSSKILLNLEVEEITDQLLLDTKRGTVDWDGPSLDELHAAAMQ